MNSQDDFSKKQIIGFLSRHFTIGDVLSVKKEKEGMANSSYKVTTASGDFLLRISLRHTFYQVGYEVKLLNILKNLPTPKLIADKQGRYLRKFLGRTAILYRYLPGRTVKRLANSHLQEIGSFLGKYHRQVEGFSSPVKRYRFYECSDAMIRHTYQRIVRSDLKKFKKEIDYLVTIIKSFRLPADLPQGAMHIDVKPENLFFTNSRLTGVVDFDNSYIGPLVLDLANTIMWNCARSGRLDFAKVKVLLKSYQRQRRLFQREINYLWPALIFLFASHIYEDMYGYVFGYRSGKLPYRLIEWEMNRLFPAQLKLIQQYEEFSKVVNFKI